jgi:hypothetical protein
VKYYEIRKNADGDIVNAISCQDADDPIDLYLADDQFWSVSDLYAREISENEFHKYD